MIVYREMQICICRMLSVVRCFTPARKVAGAIEMVGLFQVGLKTLFVVLLLPMRRSILISRKSVQEFFDGQTDILIVWNCRDGFLTLGLVY